MGTNTGNEDYSWITTHKRLCKIADRIHSKVMKITKEVLNDNEKIDTGLQNPEQKILAQEFRVMAVMDYAEEYLAGLISREDLISLCHQAKMDNFQIIKLLIELDELKVL